MVTAEVLQVMHTFQRNNLLCRPQNLRESTEKGLRGLKRTTKLGSLHNFPHMPKIQIETSEKICVGGRKIAALEQSRHRFVYIGWQYLGPILNCHGFLMIMLL